MIRLSFLTFLISFLTVSAAYSWQPWDEKEAELSMACAATYSIASKAVKDKKLSTKGQSRDEVADHFQRLSNILRYFALNSGYEDKMKERYQEVVKKKQVEFSGRKGIEKITPAIDECDNHIDKLYDSYTG